MTRMHLIKTLVGSAVLVLGSSDANAIGYTYKLLGCKYSSPIVRAGHVPTITIHNIGRKVVPSSAEYTIVHVDPPATIRLKLARSLGPTQSASKPIKQDLGKPSTCKATAVWIIPGT